ncbi:hypothetical protein [Alkalicoccus chagannorensis]|uniref:hypothetical protein n=1 Tax=Alkalicoccus chagannorensis TaxID=427072 RepID=UPI000478A75C|nr:hypothetical protein [Alkalicoccus chagannorensis]
MIVNISQTVQRTKRNTFDVKISATTDAGDALPGLESIYYGHLAAAAYQSLSDFCENLPAETEAANIVSDVPFAQRELTAAQADRPVGGEAWKCHLHFEADGIKIL